MCSLSLFISCVPSSASLHIIIMMKFLELPGKPIIFIRQVEKSLSLWKCLAFRVRNFESLSSMFLEQVEKEQFVNVEFHYIYNSWTMLRDAKAYRNMKAGWIIRNEIFRGFWSGVYSVKNSAQVASWSNHFQLFFCENH